MPISPGTGEPERIGTIRVSSNLLGMLGARPAAGRLFEAREDTTLPAATAVLSYGTWTRRFGGDPRVIGRTLTLDGRDYSIIGVLPRGFSLPREVLPTLGGAEDADVLLPLPLPAVCRAESRARRLQRDRQAEARRYARRRRKPRWTRSPRACAATTRMCTRPMAASPSASCRCGTGGGRYAPIAADPDRRCRLRAHYRLRQCREPAAGTSPGAA